MAPTTWPQRANFLPKFPKLKKNCDRNAWRRSLPFARAPLSLPCLAPAVSKVDPECREGETEQSENTIKGYNIKMRYVLPEIQCEHCILQMVYREFSTLARRFLTCCASRKTAFPPYRLTPLQWCQCQGKSCLRLTAYTPSWYITPSVCRFNASASLSCCLLCVFYPTQQAQLSSWPLRDRPHHVHTAVVGSIRCGRPQTNSDFARSCFPPTDLPLPSPCYNSRAVEHRTTTKTRSFERTQHTQTPATRASTSGTTSSIPRRGPARARPTSPTGSSWTATFAEPTRTSTRRSSGPARTFP